MQSVMETRFDHRELEKKIYKKWERSGYFNPDNLVRDGIIKKSAEKFSIVLPPPNVTGILHMGHAAMLAVEDIMVRFQRMRGKKTLWVPGTDHAAIATQSKVEKDLYKREGKTRHDLGRAKFLAVVKKFAKESHDTIVGQVKGMGASVDWSRETFTLDEERNLAVKTAFKKMYDDGLIYRGERVVNWDPKGQTTVSDDEVNHEERSAKLYTFRYSKDFPIAIATTRPETKLGDTAVAVHPNDKRYKKYIGNAFDVVFAGEKLTIKIVGEKTVDPDFGTGALGVTPAHSMADWEISQRHGLPLKQVIDERARMMAGPEGVRGEKTLIARDALVEMLRRDGLLEKEEEIQQSISVAERTGAIIEPLPKLQWFVDVNKVFKARKSSLKNIKSGENVTLKKLMQTAVRSGQIEIIPNRFNKEYFRWIDDLRDWCISRQIWYGHRVPVWYCKKQASQKCAKPIVSIEDVGKCPSCGGAVLQDPDTLDTWFSSGLWTFSTLGWPLNSTQGKSKKGSDLELYHPTSVLETGYDILFFWVARMILMTTYLLGEVPFEKVYLHGMVRDDKGKKMSKSLGNIIDPMVMAEKYGADATRLSLIIGAAPGNDIKLSEDKIRGYRNFTTKIWNASRFVIMNYDDAIGVKPAFTPEDKEVLKKLKGVKSAVTKDIENFNLHRAGETLYHYFWHTFADEIIERSKARLSVENNSSDRAAAQEVLMEILRESLKMLHPFVPFVTEEIWGLLPHKDGVDKKMLMVEQW